MKFYSFISFITCISAYLLDGRDEEKQVALYPRPGPIQKYLRHIPYPIPKPKPITLPEEGYYIYNVNNNIEEIEEIE